MRAPKDFAAVGSAFLILITSFAFLWLGGCATAPRNPVPTYVEVPIPVACTPDPKLLPDRNFTFEFSKILPSDTIYAKTAALLIEREQRISAQDQLWAALTGCTSLPAPIENPPA